MVYPQTTTTASAACWSLVQWINGASLKKILWELRVAGHIQGKTYLATNVINEWRKCSGVWSMVQWIFAVQENWTWPPSGQNWNCRVLKISWHVGLGLRNVWCDFEKDQLKTLEFTMNTRNKQIWPPGAWQMHSIPDFCPGIQLRF